jgi:hypothetical protein
MYLNYEDTKTILINISDENLKKYTIAKAEYFS